MARVIIKQGDLKGGLARSRATFHINGLVRPQEVKLCLFPDGVGWSNGLAQVLSRGRSSDRIRFWVEGMTRTARLTLSPFDHGI
ncbi:MAG: hypothetical protein LBR11_05805 [Deltaproteobacteria bacterium]|jgi:hypothetical protein|nr:hypothetical protein [Deltaproteobacteria bacterium]